MSDYGIWLSFNNQQEGFQIPVNPPSIEMREAGNSKTYDISALGEINVIKNPKLTEFRFESFFPAQRYPFVVGDHLFEPMFYVELIKKWMATNRPIRFVFTGASFDINEPVSIESFDWKEVAGTSGDIEFTLVLKKYVFYAAKKVVPVASQATTTPALVTKAPARPDDRQQPKTYTLVAGDTLWAVAQRFLGSGARYTEIQKLNNLTDADLKRLPIGKVIKLP